MIPQTDPIFGWPNVTLTLASPVAENTPTGQLGLAREFLTAAETAVNHDPVAIRPTYWLASHAMELTLKAFLLAKGRSENELRGKQVGHNIERLMNIAVQSGLGMPAGVVKVFSGVSGAHKIFYFRYGGKVPRNLTTNITVPPINDALAAARAAFGLVASEISSQPLGG
jgi:hypothetical protein